MSEVRHSLPSGAGEDRGVEMGEAGRDRLLTAVREQAAGQTCWERAETVLRASSLRERFEHLGIAGDGDVPVALMAVALVLAEGTDEWGGDYRDALAELAAVGLALLDGLAGDDLAGGAGASGRPVGGRSGGPDGGDDVGDGGVLP